MCCDFTFRSDSMSSETEPLETTLCALSKKMLILEPARPVVISATLWNPDIKPDTPDLIMSLSPELRNIIYELYVDDPGLLPYGFESDNCIARPEPALLRASRSISAEVTPMWYSSQRVYISCDTHYNTVERSMRRVRRLTLLIGPSPFLSFGIKFISYKWWRIEKLIDLLEAMRASGFEPCNGYVSGDGVPAEEKIRSIASGCSILEIPTKGGEKFREPVGRAIALGRRARDEGWSQAKLAEHFAELVAFSQSRKRKWPAHL
ncbi:hypothetical protein TI39_contig4425g00001 [Zymoseptoria brevis]|uniref:Uncharacterized protein n=1 Tax=Zymoseptoria brevis TaxID=1047168 RepID=A0A0F4G6S0_9PEZI|nr:hypothetical protein TI39_contig4425g00001 [Zymoseptoria brevis]